MDYNYDHYNYDDDNINNNYNFNNINNENNDYNNNLNSNIPPVNNNIHLPQKRRNKIIRIISLIALFLIVIFIIVTVLSFFNIIKLPWVSYPEVIKLSQRELVLRESATYQLTSEIFPSNIPYGKIVYSSSDPTVADVNQVTGFVTAKKNGMVKITAKLEDYGDVIDSCDVVVSNDTVYISKIIINNPSVNMVVGKKQNMDYSLEPNNASVHDFVFESSNEDVASVNKNGMITAKGVGKAIITISDRASNVSASQTINIFENQTIDKVSVSKSKVFLVVDGNIQLTASVKPKTANQTVTWASVDNKIATVTSNGLVTGVNYGTTKIIATAVDGTNTVVNVIVQEKNIRVKSISIDQDDFSINVGSTRSLSVTIKPSDATNQGVSWTSSNSNVVAVNSNGDVKGISPGIATITAKTIDGKYTSSIKILVNATKNNDSVKDIKLTYNKSHVVIGKSLYIKAEVIPPDASDQELTWSTNDKKIATVSSDGNVYGKGEGIAIITVTSKTGVTKSVSLIVTAIPVSSIKLSDSNRKINIGEEYPLIATISPADASYKTIKWTSSNSSILSVNEKGLVTPHKVGIATITATTTNGKSASCKFTITDEIVLPTSIKISKSQIEVKEKGKIGLTAVIQPSNATNQKVTWSIENENLAMINNQGLITGVNDGVTRVTAKTTNGKTATAFVVIKSNNKTKYNYLNGTTIKYWIENNTSKNAYITHIWVKDAYKQFATMLPSKFPGLATAPTIMKRVASKYPNKAAVGVNASGFVSYNKKNGSGFNIQFAKFNSKWNYSPAIPIVISDGEIKRDFTSGKMPDTHIITYGMKKDGWIDTYTYYKGSDIADSKVTTKRLKSDGVRNTFGFYPVLVRRSTVKPTSTTNDIRQAICQIDENNFIIYTNISNNRSNGFSFKSLANLMVSDGCYYGFNLDGGGSTNLMYKKKDSKSITGVRTTSRAVGDIIYFYGD